MPGKIQRAKSSSAKCIGKMSTMDCGVRTATGKNLVGNITRTTVIAVNKLVANNHAALQGRNGERAVAVTSDADGGEIGTSSARRRALLLDIGREAVKGLVPDVLDGFSAAHAAGNPHRTHVVASFRLKMVTPRTLSAALSRRRLTGVC